METAERRPFEQQRLERDDEGQGGLRRQAGLVGIGVVAAGGEHVERGAPAEQRQAALPRAVVLGERLGHHRRLERQARAVEEEQPDQRLPLLREQGLERRPRDAQDDMREAQPGP